MIDCLIFTRDRPAQLDLLLRSIERFAPYLYDSLVVLMRAESWEGYSRVFLDHVSLRAHFTPEADFESDVREWLADCEDYVSFLCDDDVFYRPARGVSIWHALSLRGGDYDYPFSLDGNIYRANDVQRLLSRYHFRNPTELEAGGDYHRGMLPFDRVAALDPPCLVGIPANRVSEASRMPHMGHEPGEMTERFLAGERINLDALAATLCTMENPGTHQMVEYEWESRDG